MTSETTGGSCFVEHDGVTVHYLDSGDAADDRRIPPIVFVPGMTDVAADYTEALRWFGRRTVVVEVRGHGRSGSPVDGYELEHLAADVAAVVDDVTAGPVHVATFSRGTSAALRWAIDHPDRVRSIAIGDYPPGELVPPAGAVDGLLEGRWRGTPVTDRLDPHAARRTFAAARSRSFADDVAALGVPVLVVRSRERTLVSDDVWADYRERLPSARLVEFPDSPHDIFRPDRTRYPRLVGEHAAAADPGRGQSPPDR